MANQMFGAPTGVSAAEADIRAQELHELSLGEGKVRLEQAQITLQSQKRMMELLQQQLSGGQAKPGSAPPEAGDSAEEMASIMDLMANLSIRSGMPAQAKDFATAGSTIRHQAAEIQKDRTNQMMTELNTISALMDGVHDQASWQRANAMYQMQFGKPTPYAKLPYNPQVVAELRKGIATAKDRALTSAAQAREKASIAAEKERTARIPLIRAQTQLAAERTKALQKAGATQKLPKASDVKAITDLMFKDFGASLSSEDARVLARPVAERMLDIMKSSNLPASQAAVKAYEEAKNAGDFGGIRMRRQRPGTSSAMPLDLPSDKSKLKTNMYYKGRGAFEGKVMLWTGAAFVPVGTGPGEIEAGEESELDEEEAVEDEEELDEEGIARGDYEEAQ